MTSLSAQARDPGGLWPGPRRSDLEVALPLTLTVFSDYICPFCYVGEGLARRLQQEPDLELGVRWRPFELHPDTPDEGVPLAEYFGADPVEVRAFLEALGQRAAGLGLEMTPPAALFNSHRALLLAEWAREQGGFEDVHPELFRAYFVEGHNLADLVVLRDVTTRAGLDPEAAMRALRSKRHEPCLRNSMREARRYGLTGTPTFIIDETFRIVGAQPYETLADSLRQIRRGRMPSLPCVRVDRTGTGNRGG